MIDRLRRLIFGDVRAREVEGPDWPEETRVTQDLEDVRFEPATPNVWLDHVTMRRVDLSGLRFLRLYADDCRFIGCDFSGVRVDWLPFASGGSLFRNCHFDGASIGDFGDVRLERCQFVGCRTIQRLRGEVDARVVGVIGTPKPGEHLQGSFQLPG